MQLTAEHTVPTLLIGHEPLSRTVTLASTGTEAVLAMGQPVARVTATRKVTAWDPAAGDGSEVIVGILADRATVPASGDCRAVVYTHGEFHKPAIVWGSATADQIDDAIWSCAGRGIHIR